MQGSRMSLAGDDSEHVVALQESTHVAESNILRGRPGTAAAGPAAAVGGQEQRGARRGGAEALSLVTDTRKDHFKIVDEAKGRKQIEWLKKNRPDLHERVRRALERPRIGPRRSRNVRQRGCRMRAERPRAVHLLGDRGHRAQPRGSCPAQRRARVRPAA
jgi:hypothetical protein